MVMRCGYITFCDEDTNICNVATVVVYNGNNITCTDEGTKSIYKYNFVVGKVVLHNEHQNSKILYLDLVDVINKALSIDKLDNHITKYTFSLDLNNKINVYKKSILKSCFPLPDKNFVYAGQQYYYNFTKQIFGDDVTTNLRASLACEHLNDIAIKDGYRINRMFEHSCGRVFLNVSMFLNSIEGRNLLKQILPDYHKISNIAKVTINRLTIKRFKVAAKYEPIQAISNNFGVNCHIKSAEKFVNVTLKDVLKDFTCFKQIIDFELDNIIKEFETLYLKTYINLKSGDIDYLTFNEFLKLLTDSDFAYNIANHISDVRKIYNANKSRKVDCLKSDGSIYCIQ